MKPLVFYNQNSFLKLETAANIIEYNGVIEKITKSHVVTDNLGKIETANFIIKWNNQELHLYDKIGKIMLLEKMQRKELGIFEINTETSTESKKNVYYLSRNLYVNFFESGEKFYIEYNGQEEEVTLLYKTGNYLVHKTQNFKLELSTNGRLPPKFNNLVISRIS